MGYFLFRKKCSSDKNTMSNHCIVLDLDETLIHTFDSIDDIINLGIYKDPDFIPIRNRIYVFNIDDAESKRGKGQHFKMGGILRDHYGEFLDFCFSYFKVVAIWTAGTKRYAEKIVRELTKDRCEPHVVYHREQWQSPSETCDVSNTKDLEKIMKEFPEQMSLTNTFLIDDKDYNFECNPDNGILIPGYDPECSKSVLLEHYDDNLMRLKKWFMKKDVIQSSDIRELDKTTIFD